MTVVTVRTEFVLTVVPVFREEVTITVVLSVKNVWTQGTVKVCVV